MRLMPVFSLPSISSLTSDLHVKPCLHTSPLPWLPPPGTRPGAEGRFFPARRTRQEKGFRDLFQHATEILQIPPRSHAGAAVCVCRAETGETRTPKAQPALFAPSTSRRAAAGSSAQGIAASAGAVPGRCAARLRRGHNSNDRYEGDGSHPAGLPPR